MNSQYVRITFPLNKNIQLIAPVQQSILQHPRPCIPGQVRLINSNSSVVIQPAIRSTLETNIVPHLSPSSLNTNSQILQETCSSMAVIPSREESSKILFTTETAGSEKKFVQRDPIPNMGKIVNYNF